MIRYSTFVLAILGSAATAIAALAPADAVVTSRNMTVIEKNQAFPQFGPLVVETCEVEDCSTPSN